MSTLKWIIVKNPNMREEKFLSGLSPFDWAYEEKYAMPFGAETANRISRILLEMGVSHELRQTH